MPVYDYRCVKCGVEIESRHAVSGHAPPCPACGKKMEKVILAAPAFHGHMAQGREHAMKSLHSESPNRHSAGCRCGCRQG